MVLRAGDGLVLGADVPPGLSHQRHPIRNLSDTLCVVIHDTWDFGNDLLDEFLDTSPDLEAPLATIAEGARDSFGSQCNQLAAQGQPVPRVGFLLAKVTPGGIPLSEIFGLFVANGFEPKAFLGNLYGGQYIAVARLLDEKLHVFGLPSEHILARAALYFAESRTVAAFRLDSDTSLAVITVQNGFQLLSQEQVGELLTAAARVSERIFAHVGTAFYGE